MPAKFTRSVLLLIPIALSTPGLAFGDDITEAASKIDEVLSAHWKTESVVPAEPANDSEFLRRVYLDIAGRIPLVSETREFLKDTRADKRHRAIEKLLASPNYVTNFANIWTKALIPEAQGDQLLRQQLPTFDAWARQKLADDVRYDEMVREILSMPLSQEQIAASLQRADDPTPRAFYVAKELKAENLASSASRMFLGVRIDCAQCHDHPMDKWTQNDFWGFAAFFAGVSPAGGNFNAFNTQIQVNDVKRSLKIPDSEKVMQATFLDGQIPDWESDSETRAVLADWVTSPQNPYFSRMAVNRVWGHMFGTGLVDPVDDFSDENPPMFPELLDLLAEQLIANDFNIKAIIRIIASTKTYQLTSRRSHASQDQPQQFARIVPKGLSPEQLFDSVAAATGFYQPFRIGNQLQIQNPNARTEFLEEFNNQADSVVERETTILQALSMMNGSFISNATDPAQSQTLAAVIDAPFMTNEDRIETLYLATLCRKPTKSEQSKLTKYLTSGGPQKDSTRALSDVFWALLNSSEFLFNH